MPHDSDYDDSPMDYLRRRYPITFTVAWVGIMLAVVFGMAVAAAALVWLLGFIFP